MRLTLFLTLVISVTSVSQEPDEDELAVRRWRHTFASVKKLVGVAIKAAMPHIMSSVSDNALQLSPRCRRAMFQWIADLKSIKPWALRMGDASAKVIDGLFSGTLSSFGSYDQCLATSNPKGSIHGKYCTVQAWPQMPPKPRFYALNQRLPAFKRFENDTGVMGEFTKYIQLFYMFPLRLGICIPSPCSTSDLSNITALVSKHLLGTNITVPRCEVVEPVTLENYQIPVFVAIAVLLVLVICGTVYDLNVVQKSNPGDTKNTGVFSDCLMAFSAYGNWKKLMDLEAGCNDLRVLHGVRFFSMCWIILGHTYFHLNFNILRHLQVTIELTSEFIFNGVTNATLVVDNFFFMSGLLFIYVTLDMMKTIGKIPKAVYFVVHRLWRFLPIQMFFIGLTTMLPLFGSGPVWHENIDPIMEGCKKDWWANMIFINNLFRTTRQGCLSYSWYLAADFQVYLLCIPIVILIIRKPRIGLWVNFAVMVMSVVAVAVHNYVRDLPPTMLFTRADIEQRTELMRETYYTPYQHLGPYCIGTFVGYFLHVRKGPMKIHWYQRWAGWILAFTLTSAALFGVHPWNKGYSGTGVIASMFYACLARMAWTLGLAWITVACTTGNGGLLGWILRNKVWAPFSRLTFLVYMVHPLVQHVFYSTLRGGIQALNHLAIFISFGFIISSYGLAFAISLILESPFINMGKILFRRKESYKKRRRSNGAAGTLSERQADTPQLSNGKCNEAYEQSAEDATRRQGSKIQRGDFICHL